MSKIKFTLKEHKPDVSGLRSMSSAGDPVLVHLKGKAKVKTKKGEQEINKIEFYPTSSISQAEIKNKLGISGETVKELTFEIEIDENSIKVIEPPPPTGGGFFTASMAGGSAKKVENEVNIQFRRLTLGDYKLSEITRVTADTGGDNNGDDTSGLTFICAQCGEEKPTSDIQEHNGKKYCSEKCVNKSKEKPCQQCNNTFVNLPVSSKGKSYCSEKCKKEAEKGDETNGSTLEQQFEEAERKRKAQLATEKTKLQALIDQGKGEDKEDDLKKTLTEIEKNSSSQAYQELKSEISALHQKLNQKLSISEVQQQEVKRLNTILVKNNLKLGDLDSGVQDELNNLKNVSDLTQITAQSEKIGKIINEKGVTKKFDSVFDQIKRMGTDNNKKKELKTKLEKLIAESDYFVQEYVKTHRSKIETALSQLAIQTPKKKQNNNDNQKTSLSTGQKAAIGVGIGGGVLLVGGLVIFAVRRKRSSN